MVGHRGAVAEGQLRRHGRVGVEGSHHRYAVDRAAQIQQTGALGDRRHPRRDRLPDRRDHGGVAGQLGGVHLGEPTPQVDPGRARGQRVIGDRVEDHRLEPGRGQQLRRLGVPEGEGAPASHRHRGPVSSLGYRPESLGRRPHRAGERRRGVGDGEHLGQVHVLGDLTGQPVQRCGRLGSLGHRHEPEMARRCLDAGVPWQDAEHRDAGRLQGSDDLVGVAYGAGLVQDHPGDAGVRVEGVQAVHPGGGGPGDLGDVQHQHHRRGDHPGHVRGGGPAVTTHPAVEQSHHALDHRDVGRGRDLGAVQQQGYQLVFSTEEGVEVASGSSGGQRVVAGVDEVRADLEAGRFQPVGPQRGQQPGGHGGLAVPRGGGGDHQARQPVNGGGWGSGHHSMPR